MTGEDSLYPMHLLRAGDDRADLVAAAVLRPRLRRMREGTLVHEHPDVPIGRDAAQIFVEPGLLRIRDAAPMRRPAGLHLEGVEHDHVHGTVIERRVGGEFTALEETRVGGAGVRDLVVAEGGNDGGVRQQIMLLLEPDPPQRFLARVRHHVAGVKRKLWPLGGRRSRQERVIPVVAPVVAVDEHVDGAFRPRCRRAGEPGGFVSPLDAIAVLRRGLQRGQHHAVIGDRRTLLGRQPIRLRRAVPDSADGGLQRRPRYRHFSGLRLEQPWTNGHRRRAWWRDDGRRLEAGQQAQLVAPCENEQYQQRPAAAFQRHDATLQRHPGAGHFRFSRFSRRALPSATVER